MLIQKLKMADILQDPVYVEIRDRMGNKLYTFYNEECVLGSLLLSPETDRVIINAVESWITKINESIREQRGKEERIRLNVLKSRGNG